MKTAQITFIAGTVPFIYLGAMHAIIAFKDIEHPNYFTPLNDKVRSMMQETTLRITNKTSMWKAWLGFNISHGLGIFTFGIIMLLLGLLCFDQLKLMAPIAIAFSTTYLWLSVKFWFNKPTIGITIGLQLFILSYILLLLLN